MPEEKPKPNPEYFAAKSEFRRATDFFAAAQNDYERISLECDLAENEIEAATSNEKQAYEKASEDLKKTEKNRKEIADQLAQLSKNDPKYTDLKVKLEEARNIKKQAETAKQEAKEKLNQARTPHLARYHQILEDKNQAKHLHDTAKSDLKTAKISFNAICEHCFSQTDARQTFDTEMSNLAEEIMDIRQKTNLLSAWEEEATDIVRRFISHNPVGFTKADLEKTGSYPFWINLIQTIIGTLIENPRYHITFDDLAKLIGIDKAIGYIDKIARSKVESDFKNDQLHHKDDQRILTTSDLNKITKTSFTTPRLTLAHLGQLKAQDIGILFTPEFLATDFRDLEDKKEIPTGTAEKLAEQKITTVKDLLRTGINQVSASLKETGKGLISALWKKVQ